MIWEFINPSDATVFEAADVELAALVCVLVGRGQYGATAEVDGKNVQVGLFAFQGKEETEKWFVDNFGRSLEGAYAKRRDELPAVLRSFQLGKPNDLAAYKLTLEFVPPESKTEFARRWKELRRSSMNDICGYAWQCADEIDGKRSTTDIPEPRSVFG
jgi:hypothetical protein